MDATPKQIEYEFRRQVYLCSGVGAERMKAIVDEMFASGEPGYICEHCGEKASFSRGHICPSRR